MKKGDYTQFMVAGVAFTGILCAQSFPFSGPVVSFMSAYEGISGMTVNAMAFTVYEWVFNSLALLLYILIGRFVFRFDVSALAGMGEIKSDLDEFWTTYQNLMAVLFVVFVILYLWPSFLPVLITSFCNNLVLGMIFIPIAYTFTINIAGVTATALTVALVNCCSIAMMSPAGCVPSAVFHGNKEWISTKPAMM